MIDLFSYGDPIDKVTSLWSSISVDNLQILFLGNVTWIIELLKSIRLM